MFLLTLILLKFLKLVLLIKYIVYCLAQDEPGNYFFSKKPFI